jgi:hypothetical protein
VVVASSSRSLGRCREVTGSSAAKVWGNLETPWTPCTPIGRFEQPWPSFIPRFWRRDESCRLEKSAGAMSCKEGSSASVFGGVAIGCKRRAGASANDAVSASCKPSQTCFLQLLLGKVHMFSSDQNVAVFEGSGDTMMVVKDASKM